MNPRESSRPAPQPRVVFPAQNSIQSGPDQYLPKYSSLIDQHEGLSQYDAIPCTYTWPTGGSVGCGRPTTLAMPSDSPVRGPIYAPLERVDNGAIFQHRPHVPSPENKASHDSHPPEQKASHDSHELDMPLGRLDNGTHSVDLISPDPSDSRHDSDKGLAAPLQEQPVDEYDDDNLQDLDTVQVETKVRLAVMLRSYVDSTAGLRWSMAGFRSTDRHCARYCQHGRTKCSNKG